jgi:hypothetical protein
MPVSKHRRRNKPAPSKPDRPRETSRLEMATIDDLREVMAISTLDFAAKAILAGVWWFQQLRRKAGERRQAARPSWKERRRAALLLCVAMDGEHGKNDDLSPVLAEMMRPWCPAPTFAEGWELTNHLQRGTVSTTAARILSPVAKATA